MPEIKNLQFSSGVSVTAPTEFAKIANKFVEYSDDASFEAANGTPVASNTYWNTKDSVARMYNGISWENLGSGNGSGSGELNYISNSSASINLDGWLESTDGVLDISRTTTLSELPRENLTGAGIKIVASSLATNEYVYYPYLLDDVDKNRLLKIKWDQAAISGYADDDYSVVVYDVTNAVEIIPYTSSIKNFTGQFITSFLTSDSLSYQLRIKSNVSSSPGIVISDVIVGPGVISSSSVASKWSQYTPLLSDNTNVSYNVARYRQVGETFEIMGSVAWNGAGAGTTFTVGLPSGYSMGSIDTTSIVYNDLGSATWVDAAAKYRKLSIIPNSTTSITSVRFLESETTNTWDASQAANGDSLSYHFKCSISELSDLGVVNLYSESNLNRWSNEYSLGETTTWTTTSRAAKWTRVGENMRIRGGAGVTSASGSLQWAVGNILPSGYTINEAKMRETYGSDDKTVVGVCYYDDSGTSEYAGVVGYDISSNVFVFFGGTGSVNSTSPFSWASGDSIAFDIEVPIVELEAYDPTGLVGFAEAKGTVLGIVKKNRIAHTSENIDHTTSATGRLLKSNIPAGLYKVTIGAMLFRGGDGDDAYLTAQLNGVDISVSGSPWQVGYASTASVAYENGVSRSIESTQIINFLSSTNSFELDITATGTIPLVSNPYYILEKLENVEDVSTDWD